MNHPFQSEGSSDRQNNEDSFLPPGLNQNALSAQAQQQRRSPSSQQFFFPQQQSNSYGSQPPPSLFQNIPSENREFEFPRQQYSYGPRMPPPNVNDLEEKMRNPQFGRDNNNIPFQAPQQNYQPHRNPFFASMTASYQQQQQQQQQNFQQHQQTMQNMQNPGNSAANPADIDQMMARIRAMAQQHEVAKKQKLQQQQQQANLPQSPFHRGPPYNPLQTRSMYGPVNPNFSPFSPINNNNFNQQQQNYPNSPHPHQYQQQQQQQQQKLTLEEIFPNASNGFQQQNDDRHILGDGFGNETPEDQIQRNAVRKTPIISEVNEKSEIIQPDELEKLQRRTEQLALANQQELEEEETPKIIPPPPPPDPTRTGIYITNRSKRILAKVN